MNPSLCFKYLIAALIAVGTLTFSIQGSTDEVVASGTFTGASNHVTTGGVSVVKTNDGLNVVLGADFSFDGAPDPKVGFGKNGSYDKNSQLAHLLADTGEQSYSIPSSVNVGDYNEIYIWCEKFSVPLGVAKIK